MLRDFYTGHRLLLLNQELIYEARDMTEWLKARTAPVKAQVDARHLSWMAHNYLQL